jgi:glycosyltransferase involved in cell wall biosynthesis
MLLEPPPRAEAIAPPPDFIRTVPRTPLITIAIPAYNRPHLLREALASIAAQRECDDFEVLVCDDGGLAETRRVVEAAALPRLRFYVNRTRLGAVQNWNRCLALATGRWVTILHEDDTLYPWFLASIMPRLRPGLAALAVRCAQSDAPPVLDPPAPGRAPRAYARPWFLKSSMTPFPGVVFPRELALKIGGFDPREGGIADYAFWYALARAGRIETLPVTAAFYRVSEAQWTARAWPEMLRRAHLLRLRIARAEFPRHPRLGRWLARFYTARMARSYAHRFKETPATLVRAHSFRRIRKAMIVPATPTISAKRPAFVSSKIARVTPSARLPKS